jgi:hypothetical protein
MEGRHQKATRPQLAELVQLLVERVKAVYRTMDPESITVEIPTLVASIGGLLVELDAAMGPPPGPSDQRPV